MTVEFPNAIRNGDASQPLRIIGVEAIRPDLDQPEKVHAAIRLSREPDAFEEHVGGRLALSEGHPYFEVEFLQGSLAELIASLDTNLDRVSDAAESLRRKCATTVDKVKTELADLTFD